MRLNHILVIVIGFIAFGISYAFITNNALQPSIDVGVQTLFWASIVLTALLPIRVIMGLKKFKSNVDRMGSGASSFYKKSFENSGIGFTAFKLLILYILIGGSMIAGYLFLQDAVLLNFFEDPNFVKAVALVGSSFLLSLVTKS